MAHPAVWVGPLAATTRVVQSSRATRLNFTSRFTSRFTYTHAEEPARKTRGPQSIGAREISPATSIERQRRPSWRWRLTAATELE